MVLDGGELLLDFGDLQQDLVVHQAGQVRHERDVLADVATKPAELGHLLHEPLHVLDRLELLVGVGLLLVLVDIV